ncbi:MAG: hypothetical protein MK132_16130 [Lentisphaerales bacterium]|nr:hypothetical protein [Lentisphaerales bacterium]
MSEYYEEEYNGLSEEDIFYIQETYRNQRLKEALIGPIVSTLFHIALIIVLAIMITDKYTSEPADIEVKLQEIEEVQIEEPPPIEEPVPEEVESEDAVNPVLTTVVIESAETNDSALEDISDEAPSSEDDSTVEAVSDVTVSPSAFASPTVFGGRSAGGRASALAKFGGTKTGQKNLLKALYWLQKVQNPNGSWGDNYPHAYTGLALLTFLAHGETHLSKEFGLTVRKSMQWITTEPIGLNHGRGYCHPIMTYAICEAYAMTGLSMLEEPMNRSIRKIIDGQRDNGGFDYLYNKSRDRDDLSLGGWNYQAMKAAYGAGCEEAGLTGAIDKAVTWLKTQASFDDKGNGFPYDSYNGKWRGSFTMRAVGVLCLQLYGEGEFPGVQDEIEAISTVDYEQLFWESKRKDNLYAWYYATQAMFQKGGTMWKKWNRRFQKVLNNNQHHEGYWNYAGNFHKLGITPLDEKIYATTFCSLMLTVYYRYLPTTKGGLGDRNAKKVKLVEEEELNLIE